VEGKMSTDKKKHHLMTRRNFVKTITIGGVAGGVVTVVGTASSNPVTWFSGLRGSTHVPYVPLSNGVLVVDSDICGLCGLCETVCSLTKDGVAAPELARIQVVNTFTEFDVEPKPCLQCVDPDCLRACPVAALYADKKSGTNARVINESVCIGCLKCIEACPYDPPRVRFDTKEQVAVKCDLCAGDPQCVKYCPSGALKYYMNPNGVISGHETTEGA